MPKPKPPRAGEKLIQAAMVRGLERIDRLQCRLDDYAPYPNVTTAIEAEKRALRILEGRDAPVVQVA